MRGKILAGSMAGALALFAAVGCDDGSNDGGGGKSGKDKGKASSGTEQSASPSAPPARPLSVAEAGRALLTAGDLSGEWTVGEEKLGGKHKLEKTNLRGMKGKTADCDTFLTRTNRSIGLPVVAVERSLKHATSGRINERLVSYRDDDAARRAISQLREAPGKCAEGGTKDGVPLTIKRGSAPQAGDESVGNRMEIMGASFRFVQVRVGASVADLTFMGNDDPERVSNAARKAAERLRGVAEK
ncbi:hypothetical protein ACTWQF_35955 [Streptomyces sp. 8N114]|uniref:hypothetical protein n=1 Tax=Streptomyces sp. 8N114 TaxID=3457419 RepID=UPI003FD1812C